MSSLDQSLPFPVITFFYTAEEPKLVITKHIHAMKRFENPAGNLNINPVPNEWEEFI